MNLQKSFARSERVAELVQKELASLLTQKAQDPRFKCVTLTHLDISPDLKNSTVYVVTQDDIDIGALIIALNKAGSFFRREIAHSLDLRMTPKLNFIYDESISRAERLTKLINEANKD